MGLFTNEQPAEDVDDVIEAVAMTEESDASPEPVEAPEPEAAPEEVVVIDDEDAPLNGVGGGKFIDILEPVEG